MELDRGEGEVAILTTLPECKIVYEELHKTTQ